MKKFFEGFWKSVLDLDPKIRFGGISDVDGKPENKRDKKGLKPLLSPEERAQYAITAATRQYTRLRWEYLLGRITYASSHYTKLIRATIPIADENSRLSHVLLLSFDADADNFHEIITKKVIPLVGKNMTDFIREAQK